MKHADRDGLSVYRIGWFTHHWWPRRVALWQIATGLQPNFRQSIHRTRRTRRSVRRDAVRRTLRDLRLIRWPHRPWQAEYDDCRWCRRALTARGAARKAHADRTWQELYGEWSPWVKRKVHATAVKERRA